MPFKVTHVPPDPLHDRRDWGSERINVLRKGTIRKEERKVTLKAFPLHRMLIEEIGPMLWMWFLFLHRWEFSFSFESPQHFICTSFVTLFIFYTVLQILCFSLYVLLLNWQFLKGKDRAGCHSVSPTMLCTQHCSVFDRKNKPKDKRINPRTLWFLWICELFNGLIKDNTLQSQLSPFSGIQD